MSIDHTAIVKMQPGMQYRMSTVALLPVDKKSFFIQMALCHIITAEVAMHDHLQVDKRFLVVSLSSGPVCLESVGNPTHCLQLRYHFWSTHHPEIVLVRMCRA